MDQIQKENESNAFCADCGSKNPDWASINLGVIICYECSGVHRSLGTHISKVRSLTLDRWEPQIFQLMKFIGNENTNRIYEANLPPDFVKIPPNADRTTREDFIFAKYKHKKFVQPTDGMSVEEISKQLYLVASTSDNDEAMVPTLLALLAFGGSINWTNPEQSGTTALHFFAADGNLIGLELLIQNGADLRITDTNGWTALHYAALSDRTRCARLLLNRGAQLDATDFQGLTALDLAISHWAFGVKALLEAQINPIARALT